jgi:hypothetical protein
VEPECPPKRIPPFSFVKLFAEFDVQCRIHTSLDCKEDICREDILSEKNFSCNLAYGTSANKYANITNGPWDGLLAGEGFAPLAVTKASISHGFDPRDPTANKLGGRSQGWRFGTPSLTAIPRQVMRHALE